MTDFIHKDFKQLAAKVLKEKQQDRDNYLEMEQRYREDTGSELEEDSDSEEPIQFNSKRHHRVIKELLKYNFKIHKLDDRYILSEQRKLERGKEKKITDEQHGWLIVLGKPAENFNLDLFLNVIQKQLAMFLRSEIFAASELQNGTMQIPKIL